MHFNTEVLSSLTIALQIYKGKRSLEYLNISGNRIGNDGLKTISESLGWTFFKINIRELIMKQNQLVAKSEDQGSKGSFYLGNFLKKIDNL